MFCSFRLRAMSGDVGDPCLGFPMSRFPDVPILRLSPLPPLCIPPHPMSSLIGVHLRRIVCPTMFLWQTMLMWHRPGVPDEPGVGSLGERRPRRCSHVPMSRCPHLPKSHLICRSPFRGIHPVHVRRRFPFNEFGPVIRSALISV